MKMAQKKKYKSNAKRITQNCSTILKMTPYFYGKCISHICFRIFWPKYRKKTNSNFPFSKYHFLRKKNENFFYLKVLEYFLPRYQFMSLVATFSPFSNLEKENIKGNSMSTILTANNFYLKKHEMAFFSFIYYTLLCCYYSVATIQLGNLRVLMPLRFYVKSYHLIQIWQFHNLT